MFSGTAAFLAHLRSGITSSTKSKAITVAIAKSKGQSKEHTLADLDSTIIKSGSKVERGVGGVDGYK